MQGFHLVTGASSGLGQAIARCLLEQGKKVALLGRDRTRLCALADAYSTVSLVLEVDVCERDALFAALEPALNWEPELLSVYNCAGSGVFKPCEEYTSQDIDTTLGANLVGLIHVSQWAAQTLGKGGQLIQILSTAATEGKAGESVYCAAKWGAKGFSLALRDELKAKGIHVGLVYPGGMNTPFWQQDGRDASGYMCVEQVAKMIVNNFGMDTELCCSDLVIRRR